MYFKLLSEQDVDVYVLNGDIFEHPNPTLYEIDTFYEGINTLPKTSRIIITDGNHEALSRKVSTFDLLPTVDYEYIEDGIIHTDAFTDIYLVGHRNINGIIHKVRDLKTKNNILISHIRCTVGMIKEELNLKLISNMFHYVFLGDIHFRYKPFDNVEYTSQPYNDKYTPEVDTGFIILTLHGKKYTHEYHKVSLPNKIRLRVDMSDLDDTLKTLKPSNKYKIIVSGTLDEFEALKPPMSNVIYDKIIISEEESLDEMVDDLKADGKIDIIENLIKVAMDAYELTPEHEELGREILRGIDIG